MSQVMTRLATSSSRRIGGTSIRRSLGRVAIIAAAFLGCLLHSAVHGADFLDADDAFKFSAVITDRGKMVEVRFNIADGYYLYRERFGFTASDGVQLGTPQYPPGKIKFDETFNKDVVTDRGDVVVKLPVEYASGAFTLTVRLQGCADRGLCYPPQERSARLLLRASASDSSLTRTGRAPAVPG